VLLNLSSGRDLLIALLHNCTSTLSPQAFSRLSTHLATSDSLYPSTLTYTHLSALIYTFLHLSVPNAFSTMPFQAWASHLVRGSICTHLYSSILTPHARPDLPLGPGCLFTVTCLNLYTLCNTAPRLCPQAWASHSCMQRLLEKRHSPCHPLTLSSLAHLYSLYPFILISTCRLGPPTW
jgi:hypothetical protein